jgi:hypothetical protein
LFEKRSTASTLTAKRRRISSSSAKAFTIRIPCTDSCSVSMICMLPINCVCVIARTRRISLRKIKRAGGAMRRPVTDIIGVPAEVCESERGDGEKVSPARS